MAVLFFQPLSVDEVRNDILQRAVSVAHSGYGARVCTHWRAWKAIYAIVDYVPLPDCVALLELLDDSVNFALVVLPPHAEQLVSLFFCDNVLRCSPESDERSRFDEEINSLFAFVQVAVRL